MIKPGFTISVLRGLISRTLLSSEKRKRSYPYKSTWAPGSLVTGGTINCRRDLGEPRDWLMFILMGTFWAPACPREPKSKGNNCEIGLFCYLIQKTCLEKIFFWWVKDLVLTLCDRSWHQRNKNKWCDGKIKNEEI